MWERIEDYMLEILLTLAILFNPLTLYLAHPLYIDYFRKLHELAQGIFISFYFIAFIIALAVFPEIIECELRIRKFQRERRAKAA